MKSFKELGIASPLGFTGEKIGIYSVFNREIVVYDFKIGPSKFPKKGCENRLDMQIKIDEEERVVFTTSGILMDQIKKVEKADFPFTTTIIKENKGFRFT